ncbi:MAG: peptide chain release factor N(5)-glutamine methyltransferase [Woeseia sp.]
MRIDAALANAADTLRPSSDSPRLDAEVLLARALDLPKSWLYAHPEDELDAAAAERFVAAVERRRDGVPIAYITGEKEFWSLTLAVSPDVLVPRPETELLVELALRHIPPTGGAAVLDLGTGSGAIALALASERPNCSLIATDLSRAALAVARQNARQLGFCNIEFLEGDWTRAVAACGVDAFDVIVSNPPYLADNEPALRELQHEPVAALMAGPDGLSAIRVLARDCRFLLRPGGLLLLEHGAGQQQEVAQILAAEGWSGIECFKDLAGQPRATCARLPATAPPAPAR